MTKKQKQSHYYEVFNIFVVVLIGIVAYVMRDSLTATIITIAILIYLGANITHAAHTKTLSMSRVLEFGAIALIAEFILLTYVI